MKINIISILLILMSLGFFFGARVYNSIWGEQKAQCSETTSGVVTEIVEHMDYDSQNDNRIYTYRASVEYSVDNKKHVAEDSVGYGKNSIPYSVGDSVTVHYNPDDNQEIYLDEGEMLKVPTVFNIIGGSLIGLAILVMFLAGRSSKKYNQYQNSN